jgi:hypothetical protein
MEKISCEIIKDLLPLYYDEVCSIESTRLIEEHLAECEGCRLEMDRIKAAISLPQEVVTENNREGDAIKGVAATWKRSKVKAFVIGVFGAALLFGGYVGLFKWDIMKVSADVVEISNVSKLSNGLIVYQMRLTDGFNLNRIKYDMDEYGNFYLTPIRPIVKTKAEFDIGLHNTYQTFSHEKLVYKEKYGDDAEIKALYFRTSEKDILIWKKGMDLPAASDEVEAEFHSIM